MSDIERAAAEAVAIAKGESPAARIYHNGHFYVPQAEVERLRAALRPFSKAAEGFDRYNIKNPEEWFCYGGVQGSGETTGAITVGDLRRARAALGEKP